MAELSPHDAELLAQDLPELAQVAVASPIYPGHRGQVEYCAARNASNSTVLMLHGILPNSSPAREASARWNCSRFWRHDIPPAPGAPDRSARQRQPEQARASPARGVRHRAGTIRPSLTLPPLGRLAPILVPVSTAPQPVLFRLPQR